MLTQEQKQTFLSRGYIHLPGIAGDRAADFEAFVWARLEELHGIRRNDRATWDRPGPWVGMKNGTIPTGGWHVDYHYTRDLEPLFGLRVFSFLSDVEPRGGGTLIISGSHRLVADYVKTLSAEERTAGYAKVRDRMHASLP